MALGVGRRWRRSETTQFGSRFVVDLQDLRASLPVPLTSSSSARLRPILWAVCPISSVLPRLVKVFCSELAPRTPPARCHLPPSATVDAVSPSVTSAPQAIVPRNVGFYAQLPPPRRFMECRPLVWPYLVINMLRLPTFVCRLLGVNPTLPRAPPPHSSFFFTPTRFLVPLPHKFLLPPSKVNTLFPRRQ